MESFLQSLIKALPDTVSPAVPRDRIVIVDEKDPVPFWNKVTGALSDDRCMAILDPDWPDSWKREYMELASDELQGDSVRILIPTSGTSGKPKFCVHTLDTLSFAAKAFADAYSSKGILHSVNVLPQHHVGGFMPVLRSALSAGKTCFASYQDDFNRASLGFEAGGASISLVPTQLARILKSESLTNGLRRFGMILAGGAACPASLLDKSRRAGLRLAPCYGSTETAALVTLLDPDAFLGGESSVGKPLPGMRIELDQNELIRIHSESVQTGYCPVDDCFRRSPYVTSDLGMLDQKGNLHILGRADNIIITGGKKVIPGQVEAVCHESGLVHEAWCYGVHDPDWGMRVELNVVFKEKDTPSQERFLRILRDQLPGYAVPKHIHPVDEINRNAIGKIIRPV